MNEPHQASTTTLVVGNRVVRVGVDRSGAPMTMIVNVEVDYEQLWSFEEPGWQDLAFGVADGRLYWWSARHVVVVLGGEHGEPALVSADEDIRFAFLIPFGWLLVCETSVRLVVDDIEVSRLELGEVVLAARWEAPQLVIVDANGHDITIAISEGQLTT